MIRFPASRPFGLAAALLMALAGSASAQRTLNHGLHAVPAPAEVKIDGDLGEWDTSGAILLCKDVASLADVESARVAAMWDARGLTIGIAWRDTTPMVNKIDPVTMPGNGWRSDCVQFRCNMGGFISHVDAWYYSDGKRPAMTIAYGPLGAEDAPKVDRPAYPEELGAEQGFQVSPDGKGYVQEIRIPWAVLTRDGKQPAAGADLRLGIEAFWGAADAQTWPKSRVTDNLMDGETQTDFFWTNTKAWGRLILEAKGRLALPPPPWEQPKEEPEGLASIAFKVPRTSYVTLAIEDAAGNRVRSLVGGVRFKGGVHMVRWSGLDDRNEVLPPGRYRWRGLYRDAIDIRWLMSFYQPNESVPWNNQAGTGGWGPDHGYLMAAAAGDGRVYLGGLGAEAGNPLFAADEKGAKVWTQKSGEPDHLAFADGTLYGYTSKGDSNWLGITARGVMQFDAKTGRWLDIPTALGKPTRRLDLLAPQEAAAGFAADAAGLYLAVKGKDEVRAFSRRSFVQHRRFAVPGAGELFAPGDGRLLICSAKGLLGLDLESGEVRTLVADDLGAAQGVTADAKGRLVYVSVGAPRHQVLVYERQEDEAVRVAKIGQEGGRTQNGPYDPAEGLFNPGGLAVDGSGRLWVAEMGYRPKRVSVWKGDAKGYGWVRDFIGDTGYGGGGVINPLDPTMAFYGDMQFEIDLGSGRWKLKAVGLVLPEGAEAHGIAPTAGDHATGGDLTAEYMNAFEGRAYIHSCRGARRIFREREDGRWALCVFIDPKQKLAWVDRNDDGRVQDGEVVRGGKDADWGGTDYWGMRPSQGLDQFFTRGIDQPGLHLKCQGVTAGGTPLYDFTKFERMAGECMNGIGLRDGSYNSGCAGERGEYFSEMRRIEPPGVPGRTFWFRGENTGRWTFRLPEPGVVLYPFQAHGIADVPSIEGEVVCWVSDFGQRYLFTDDMLYVDQLFADARTNYEEWPDQPRRGFRANTMAPGQESFHGTFVRLKDGRYVLTTGFTDCRVFEVKGLDSLRRLEGEVELREDHLARAREIREFRLSGGKVTKAVSLGRAPAPIQVDGKLDEWKDAEAVRIEVDEQRGARVRVTSDDAALYVAWDVRDPTPMEGNVPRWELAFKGGDAVDLQFRRPGEKADDAAVRDGDLRLLVTQLDGKARAVLYRPVSANRKPFLFDAFEGANRPNAVRMDEVRLADEVRTAIATGEAGYAVEAAIPWSLLGGKPPADAEGRIDFGVLFGDPKGTTGLRAYWSNRDTNIVTDIPSEAELKPANWGTLRTAK